MFIDCNVFIKNRYVLFGYSRVLVCLLLAMLMVACSSVGTLNIVPDRINYNEVIGRSDNEQMLFNLIRIRYHEVPVFLTVSSVLTQYTYGSNANLFGQAGVSGGFDTHNFGYLATYFGLTHAGRARK